MRFTPRQQISIVVGFVLCSAVVVVSAQHQGVPLSGGTYFLTEYIQGSVSIGSLAAVFALTMAAGGMMRGSTIALALGCTLVPAFATIIELIRDSSTHNLLGLEIVIYWIPLFLIALGGSWLGSKVRDWLVRN